MKGSVATSVHGEGDDEASLDVGLLLQGLGDAFADVATHDAAADRPSPEEAGGQGGVRAVGARDEL